MTSKNLAPSDFVWIFPASVIVGAGLAAIQPGIYWVGWTGFSALFVLGLSGLLAAWRWAGGGQLLAWMMGLALMLRLAAGIAVYVALPLDGYHVPDDQAGYVFTDAHRRDDQAWELASSGKALWSGFDKSFYTDQYGGLLVLSALAYKVFSPDSHRPLLILSLAAATAALGVPFLVRATRLLWDDKLAAISGWLFVLYPESVLTGGAQMREPFLLTFIAMAYWGFARWYRGVDRKALLWVGIAIACTLLVSPAIALLLLIFLGGWLWLRGEQTRLSWPLLGGIGGAFLVGVLLLAWSLSRRSDFAGGSPVANVLNLFRGSVNWVIYQLESGSGQVQNVFSKLNPLVQFLFVVGYGITQPLLPPAFFEPTTLTWHVIAVFRALGWYVLLPLLLYAPFAAWRAEPGGERRSWLWALGFCWLWILICAIRAGGDQWDNPRYRLIFLGFEALVAGYAWLSWRANRDAWLPRIVLVEILCLMLFAQWYLARYYLIGIHFPIMVVLGLSLTGVAVILGGGWLWDRWRPRADASR
jgi:hypothetical protein